MRIGKKKKTGIISLCCIAVIVSGLFFTGCINSKKCVDYCAGWMLVPSGIPMNDSVISVMKSPDSVVCYKLHITDNDSVVPDSLPPIPMNCGQIAVLQYNLLFDNSNYFRDSIIIQSPNIPVVEFEMKKGNYEPVRIRVSLSDFSWDLFSGNDHVGSYNYTSHNVIDKFCNYFIQKVEHHGN